MRRLPAARLGADARGTTAVEFALALPLLLAAGGYGLESANLALTHLRVSQYALYLADNASRVGLTGQSSGTQLREVDINDILQGLRLQGGNLKLTTYGRVTLSSLEAQSDGSQLLHWQRCIGVRAGTGYDSSYGSAGTGTAGTKVTSMGDSWAPVTAPAIKQADGKYQYIGVMFVEINYDYQPLFGKLYVAPQKLHYTASYLVRDVRDYSKVYNPSPTQAAASCSLHAV